MNILSLVGSSSQGNKHPWHNVVESRHEFGLKKDNNHPQARTFW
jgi:alkylated DNA nucleotide flippase Atl1